MSFHLFQYTYSSKEGSKGHTFMRPGQVVHRRIMDGDIVFINRPPTTHKHSLQALKVYVHSDCCSFCSSSKSKWTDVPCIQFHWQGTSDDILDRASYFVDDTVYPVLLQTIIKGDPRVSTANVVWTSPDTTTWMRSPSKSVKGELAVDIILEKEVVRKSGDGDAWRVVMDSCLSVIHLIDTRRSIPYAIKQVQELLGISCAFEQAVQRFSTSVTLVTKGVLKDHLLLLGNSMTCAGTLIGFNAGAIKSLSRSLNVQVTFMNATLFNPRKCFEKAAEKCHVDNLSSIFSSCAWGKHVSVGIGCPFEILWDMRKAELKPQKEIDVFNFLHLVNTSSKPEDISEFVGGEDLRKLLGDKLHGKTHMHIVVLLGLFVDPCSKRTGLLVQLEDPHLLGIKSPRNDVFWETTMESYVNDYRTIEGINIAHSGRTSFSLFRFCENAESHTRARMEEVWNIEEVDFNIKGLSAYCFMPPAYLKRDDHEIGECDLMKKGGLKCNSSRIIGKCGNYKVVAFIDEENLESDETDEDL